MIRQHKIPLVLVSSKTLAELEDYREQLQLAHPVVAENGATLFVPDAYFTRSPIPSLNSISRAKLRSAYEKVKSAGSFDCLAFYELGISGIVRETGLTEQQASRANDRESSEPILWCDSEARASEFESAMNALGLRCVMGGRFMHLLGNTGKEDAVRQVLQAYADEWPDRELVSVSLGDGPNDLGMLSRTDIAVIIPGKHKHRMELRSQNRILRPSSAGPVGWNEAMLTLFKEIDEDQLSLNDNGE